MDKWFRRAVGSAGVAGAVLLLGAGTAPALASAPAAVAPQHVHDVTPDPGADVPDSLHPGIDGPNMIGDDFVDQSPYADPLPASTLDLPFTAHLSTAASGRPKP